MLSLSLLGEDNVNIGSAEASRLLCGHVCSQLTAAWTPPIYMELDAARVERVGDGRYKSCSAPHRYSAVGSAVGWTPVPASKEPTNRPSKTPVPVLPED